MGGKQSKTYLTKFRMLARDLHRIYPNVPNQYYHDFVLEYTLAFEIIDSYEKRGLSSLYIMTYGGMECFAGKKIKRYCTRAKKDIFRQIQSFCDFVILIEEKGFSTFWAVAHAKFSKKQETCA